jgi:hypothetical protein
MHPSHHLDTPSPQRRLLTPEELADKLGSRCKTAEAARRWLKSQLPDLVKKQGFPPAVLASGRFPTHRWDSLAIDLWLDKHLPANLSDHRARPNLKQADATLWETRLNNRLHEVRL